MSSSDLYDQLCSYDNLELAFKKARKRKTLKPYVIEFEEYLHENLLQLRNELLFQTYKPQPLKTFILRDPKTRKISKSHFKDRVVHHALCNIIEPIFDKTFIHDSFANRLGKGTLNAIKRFDFFKKRASRNNKKTCYVLKADIRQYFDTVDHGILLSLIQKRVKDKRILSLIATILVNHKTKEVGMGMPLGNLTSQFFANIYLHELDRFVKHHLKAKYYIRYVDDFVILHQSKNQLKQYKEKINNFLKNHLALTLHPVKSTILTLPKGVGFLGFRIFFHHHLLRKKNMNRFERRFNQLSKNYKEEKVDREKVVERFEGWLAYATHANTYKYRRYFIRLFNQAFPLQQDGTITNMKKHTNFKEKLARGGGEHI